MLAIRAERAFDGERLLRGGVVVLVDEGRIVAVGRDAMAVPADVRVAGFPDATVLPGLVDAHVHLCGDGRPGAAVPGHTAATFQPEMRGPVPGIRSRSDPVGAIDPGAA